MRFPVICDSCDRAILGAYGIGALHEVRGLVAVVICDTCILTARLVTDQERIEALGEGPELRG